MNEKKIFLVGCGGGGSYLAPVLLRTIMGMNSHSHRKMNLVLMDGDVLEKRNIERQLYTIHQIGTNKAKALYDNLRNGDDEMRVGNILSYGDFYLSMSYKIPQKSILMVCVDNHPGRKTALQIADMTDSKVIIAGNESTDAEAYYYEPNFRNTPADPRIYYPELLTNHTGDPLSPCTGDEAVNINPQLPSANFIAVALAMQLFMFWFVNRKRVGDELDAAPMRINANFAGISTTRWADLMKGK